MAIASLNGTVDSNFGLTASPVVVAVPFVDVHALSVQPGKGSLSVGKSATATLSVRNEGNSAATGTATVTISLTSGSSVDSPATQIGTASIRISLRPGQAKALRVAFHPSTLPAPGKYHEVLTLVLAGDTNPLNNSALSGSLITVQ